MSYVDRYGAMLREAADRQARGPSAAERLRPHARRVATAALVAAAALGAAMVLPDLRTGERATAPAPPEDPLVIAYLAAVRDSGVTRDAACRPPRRGPARVSDAAPAAATREAFGVFRRQRPASARLLRQIRGGSDPRAVVLGQSVRLLGRPPRAVLFVMRGPFARFMARDPRRCNELMQAELDRRTARSSDAVRAGARRELERKRDRELALIASEEDRLYLFVLDARGRLAGGGGGVTAQQARRTGMSGSSLVRVRGRRARSAYGLVPDGVAEVEIVARGAGERPWVRRHRVRVRDNLFLLEGFHAASFSVRWLDARGREIERG